ncbi:MAG: hypothetical protein HWD59_04950 [Coxiellaceae bacterium]|nr:MAG: hypothetical protein HWD59_04950 [Coxiellaceae bacterium]
MPKEPQGLPQENCLLIAKMIQNISSRLNQRKMLDSATRFQLANAGLTAAQAAESTMLQQYFSAEQQICSIDDCLVAWRDTKDLDQLFAAVNDFIPFIEQGCTIETYNYLKQIVVDLSTEKCLDHNQFNLDSNQGINFISWFTRSIEAESYFWIEILAELAPINISIFEDIILFSKT